jgi:hypothetical protein
MDPPLGAGPVGSGVVAAVTLWPRVLFIDMLAVAGLVAAGMRDPG